MTDGISVLSSMVSGVMERRPVEASEKPPKRTLTPIAAEKVRSLPATPAAFPNDDPQEVIEGVVTELERQIGYLQQVVVALRGVVKADAPAETVDVKAKERAADERALTIAAAQRVVDSETVDEAVEVVRDFNQEFAAMQKAAQESVYTPETEVWKCPAHGESIETTSPKGRVYRKCGSCTQFER